MNKISFLIASKNDNFEGKPIERLSKVLELSSMKMDPNSCEFLIADWGSDIPIHEELKIKTNCPIKIFYIPKEITDLYPTPISEVHCLNLLAKNASHEYVGRIDQDTVIGYRFKNWLENTDLDDNTLYYSNRKEMPQNVITENDELVNYQTSNFCANNCCNFAVGILMTSKKLWCSIQGYNQKYIYRNDMEHEFTARLKSVGSFYNLGCKLDCPFYHIWHTRHEGMDRTFNRLSDSDFTTIVANDDNWGLEQFKDKIEIINYR